MAEIILFQPNAAKTAQIPAKRRQISVEDEALIRRMRRVWRRCDDMLADIYTVKKAEYLDADADLDISDRTFQSWWSRTHKISWAGGKLIEKAMRYRLAEARKAVLEQEADMRARADDFTQKPRILCQRPVAS